MSNARNLARVVADTSGAIAATNLANAVPADGSITNAKLASGAVTAAKVSGALGKANMASGSVIQTVQYVYGTPTSGNNNMQNGLNDWGDSGLAITITPTSSSNKILVFGTISGCIQQYTYERLVSRLVRGSTPVLVGAGSSNRAPTISATTRSSSYGIDNQSFSYLDSPATTAATTYKIQLAAAGGGALTWLINYSGSDGDNNSYTPRGVSMITAMEIAA